MSAGYRMELITSGVLLILSHNTSSYRHFWALKLRRRKVRIAQQHFTPLVGWGLQ